MIFFSSTFFYWNKPFSIHNWALFWRSKCVNSSNKVEWFCETTLSVLLRKLILLQILEFKVKFCPVRQLSKLELLFYDTGQKVDNNLPRWDVLTLHPSTQFLFRLSILWVSCLWGLFLSNCRPFRTIRISCLYHHNFGLFSKHVTDSIYSCVYSSLPFSNFVSGLKHIFMSAICYRTSINTCRPSWGRYMLTLYTVVYRKANLIVSGQIGRKARPELLPYWKSQRLIFTFRRDLTYPSRNLYGPNESTDRQYF